MGKEDREKDQRNFTVLPVRKLLRGAMNSSRGRLGKEGASEWRERNDFIGDLFYLFVDNRNSKGIQYQVYWVASLSNLFCYFKS